MEESNVFKCETQIYDEIMRAYKHRPGGGGLFPFYEIIKLMRLKKDSLNISQGEYEMILTNSLILLNTLFLTENHPQMAPEVFV